MAWDPQTATTKWTYEQFDVSDSGMLTTATDLLFTGGREGRFHALDARTGALLWRARPQQPDRDGAGRLPGEGRRYVSVIAGNTLVTFGLRDARR